MVSQILVQLLPSLLVVHQLTFKLHLRFHNQQLQSLFNGLNLETQEDARSLAMQSSEMMVLVEQSQLKSTQLMMLQLEIFRVLTHYLLLTSQHLLMASHLDSKSKSSLLKEMQCLKLDSLQRLQYLLNQLMYQSQISQLHLIQESR